MDARWLKWLPGPLRRRLVGRHNLQAILGNSGWLFADKIIRMGVGLFVGVWVARYLGPEQYGQISFAMAFVSLFAAVATLGLDGIVVRELVRSPAQKEEILGSAFALKLTGGCAAFLIAQAAIWLLRPADNLTHWLVGIIAAGMIFQAFDVIDLWFQSQVRSKFTVYARNVAFVILSLVKVALILNGAELKAFAWAALAEVALGGMALVIIATKLGPTSWYGRMQWLTMRRLLVESWPLLFSGLAIMLYMRIDQVMLAEMVGEREVGLYSAALKLSEVWYIIPVVIVSSVAPTITDLRARSQELYYQRLQQLFTNLTRIAYLVAIAMTLISTHLVIWLYGNQYANAGPVLAVHIWAAVFVFLGVGAGPWVLNEGLTKFSLYQTVLGALTNISLNLILIPLYGAIGCAIATLISQALAACLANGFFHKTVPLFRLQVSALLLRKN